jgi:hypothetical protein
MKGNVMNAIEVLTIVARTNFTAFDETDFSSFAGVVSENPLIGYFDDYTIVIDSDVICVINAHGDEAQFRLGEDLMNVYA